MPYASIVRSAVTTVVLLAAAPVFAQKPATNPPQPQPAEAPDPSSLVVGALQVGSATNLAITGMGINVAGNSVTYSYYMQNKGSTQLSLTASMSLPDLQASADGNETWVFASDDPENPVGLTITAADAAVQMTAQVNAYALGIDRTAEIKAEHLPLIPFGPAADKALAALSPQVIDRLAASGLISPQDPSQPKAPPTADWTLKVVRSGRLVVPPGKTIPVIVKFTPVVAQYRLTKDDQDGINDMKDDLCLKPPVLGVVQSRLKGGGVWKVTDISLDPVAPTHWNDNPKPTVSIQKPGPNAIVAFCGIDEKTAGKPLVLGAAPDDSEEIRIVIFQPVAK